MNTAGNTTEKLHRSFYQRANVAEVAQDLLGKVLVTHIQGVLCKGRIVEVEAYSGRNDRACHAFGKRTPRTEVMYGQGGHAYVYLCYGIHHLFNIVTHTPGLADAVLVRAIEPLEGEEAMLLRRGKPKLVPALTAGPGALGAAMGITVKHNSIDLLGNTVWVEDDGLLVPPEQIIEGSRVGVAYAQEDALRPWRYSIRGNAYVSKGKGVTPQDLEAFQSKKRNKKKRA